MREIKFRQWDSVHKRMEYGAGAKKPSGWVGFSNVSWDRYPIMQYTGLKDKNGVEIYEEDIVKMNTSWSSYSPWGDSDEVDMDFIGLVIITATKGACIKKPYWVDNLEDNSSGRYQHYKPISAYRSEIIGNKYENPELLNDKEE